MKTLLAFALALGVLVAVQLYPTLDSYFMADDFAWLGFVSKASSPRTIAWSLGPGGFTSPVCNSYFWMLFAVFGTEPRGYYVANAFLHVLNAALTGGLIFLVTRDLKVAGLGTAFFALHFSQFSDWGALVWIAVFEQLVVAFFYLLSLLLFVMYIQRKRVMLGALSLLTFVGALLTRGTAMSLPVMLVIVLELFYETWRGQKPTLTKIMTLTAPFWVVLIAYVMYELSVQLSGPYLQSGAYGFGTHLITNLRYFSNLVVPNPSSPPVHSFLQRALPAWGVAVAEMLALAVSVGLVVVGIVVVARGARADKLWLALLLVAHLPFLPFVQGFAGPNRYFYISLVGFSALLAGGLCRAHRWLAVRMGSASASAIAAIAIIGLWSCNLMPIRVWQWQMNANSVIRREVVTLAHRSVAAAPSVCRSVCIEGFPGKYGDLPNAVRSLVGVEGYFVTLSSPCPDAFAVRIALEDGQVVVR